MFTCRELSDFLHNAFRIFWRWRCCHQNDSLRLSSFLPPTMSSIQFESQSSTPDGPISYMSSPVHSPSPSFPVRYDALLQSSSYLMTKPKRRVMCYSTWPQHRPVMTHCSLDGEGTRVAQLSSHLITEYGLTRITLRHLWPVHLYCNKRHEKQGKIEQKKRKITRGKEINRNRRGRLKLSKNKGRYKEKQDTKCAHSVTILAHSPEFYNWPLWQTGSSPTMVSHQVKCPSPSSDINQNLKM